MLLLIALLGGFGDWLTGFSSSASFWLLSIVGIGLVVFVHEAGHFLVAKHYGVRVEIFSLGFGPRLLGFKRGDTDYRLSLVPIGGYVKMAGDNPGEPLQGDGAELPAKPVGQRFAIFAAGVVMNLIFAVVALPIALAAGVQFTSTRVGTVQPGGPAWVAGVTEGDEVLAVDGHRVADFNDVIAEIALSGKDGVELEVARPADGTAPDGAPVPRRIAVQPEYDAGLGRYVVGIGPPIAPTFEVERSSPAAKAGITASDRIVRFDGRPVASPREFEQLRQENRAERVTLGVVGTDGVEREVVVAPGLTAEPLCLIGIKPYENVVKALRGRAVRDGFLLAGDELLGVDLVPAGAEEPKTLPIGDAEDLAAAFEQAGQSSGAASLRVRRNGEVVLVGFHGSVDRALANDVALTVVPGGRRVRLMTGYPAALAGVPEGAEITRVNRVAVSTWAEIKERIEKAAPSSPDAAAEPVEIVAEVDGTAQTFAIKPRCERLPIEFGLVPMFDTVERSYPFLEAVQVGVSSAGYMLKNVYLTLKKIFAAEVSAKNLSGIITIAYVSRSLAEAGIPTLFFFLAVLSLNLAFLNLLPIPVLDGGHLFFLIVEKVKGSPVSERVMGFSQLVGLVLVLALLLFVTYNDLRRFLGG